ncbi:DNA polymerase I [Fundicoccus culcitae]|uniref:DNA polymerase I n=1 Tax=Fundicoccus culcitae TaxID=2969821 RepID=A0ABY5P5Z6_9LACT|nr:DNA polymerase I [Fundicoccus culcitae]UUX34164.1 DNA polymerase I [Fundicoccus culcitae]
MSNNKIMLIDGSSLAFRAFFSIVNIDQFKNKAGLHTNALYSFNLMLNTVLEQFKPTHILVAFDKSETTFRNEKYSEYKGGRQKIPSEFREQMPYFRVLLDAYGIEHYEILNYEADDIIGTLASQADKDDEVIVISGDKDLIQLANANTTVYITRKGVSEIEPYTVETINDKYGLTPNQIIDLKGLMGDSSDNYPGVTRIGEKTGIKLLQQFGSIENMYDNLDEIKPSKMKDNIINDQENAFMSKDLATILTDAPIEISIEDIEYKGKDIEALAEFYRNMDFHSFLNNLQTEYSDQLTDEGEELELNQYDRLFIDDIKADYLPKQAVLYYETLEENYHFADLEAVTWLDIEQKKVYTTTADTAFKSELFKAWLASEEHRKITWDSKRDAVITSHFETVLNGIQFDTLIAAYLIDLNNTKDITDVLAVVGLPSIVKNDEAVYGKGVKRAIPEDKDVFEQHLFTKVIALEHLMPELKNRLESLEMMDLYTTIEFPLAKVLADMEIRGVKVNGDELSQMNVEMSERLKEMEEEIYDLAGEKFNINSPKQLGVILFEKLGLPVIKKTKTGYSTAADVLEKLAGKHPIINAILDYRQLAKLQGTYLEGLPPYIKEDGHIHTRFVQTLTQTGRLSSTDPNLQNIPIRMEEGRKIRKAFIPSQENWLMFGADYSQIELRVLAHISKDEHMQQAFIDGEDIHSSTARRVFDIPENEAVTSEHRRQAKAVNFGIVYGISDYGLSQNLNISRKQAKDFIDRYFEQYPGIKRYMEEIVEEAKETGYVSTLFNRRRYLPDIHSSNFNLRSFAERTAMNSPIQGTAADIIKIAMVTLQKAIDDEKLQAQLLLQVHDELILEAPAEEIERLNVLVPEIMENAVELSVPLKVDYNHGSNWYELK